VVRRSPVCALAQSDKDDQRSPEGRSPPAPAIHLCTRPPWTRQGAGIAPERQTKPCRATPHFNFRVATDLLIIHFAFVTGLKTPDPLIFVIARLSRLSVPLLLALLALANVNAQLSRPFARPQPHATPPMKRASELINRQEPINVSPRLLARLTPDNSHVRVSISKQRAYLMMGDEIVIDSPISSGKRARPTPQGSFHVLEKDLNHKSTIYGDFVDSSGRVVRRGVSSRIDSAPSGTHFVGADMKWFMRLTDEGVGMHVGFLPGYAASHGCVRMPSSAAEMFYNHVKVGTPVVVGD
jgi:lipoprotein-anchoring transpeptidase ErfK/SrfK